MATKKFSALSTGTAPQAADKIPIERSGANYYLTPTMLHTRARIDNNVSPFNNVTIPNNVRTAITFDNEAYDTGGYFSAGQPTRLTAAVAGLYLITGQIEWSNSTTTGKRSLIIRLNNTTDIGVADDGITTHTLVYEQNISIQYVLAANDYVQLCGLQSSGGDLDILQEDYSPIFSIVFLGP
jgi:hypothetical protein